MSVDDHHTAWSSRFERGIQGNSPEKNVLDGGELLTSPSLELEVSMRRRNTLLKSLDLLNTLVLDDLDLT